MCAGCRLPLGWVWGRASTVCLRACSAAGACARARVTMALRAFFRLVRLVGAGAYGRRQAAGRRRLLGGLRANRGGGGIARAPYPGAHYRTIHHMPGARS